MHNCLSRSVQESLSCCWDVKQPTNNNNYLLPFTNQDVNMKSVGGASEGVDAVVLCSVLFCLVS